MFCFFFFNDTATTEIYTLSLHDALPICRKLAALLGERCERETPVRRFAVRENERVRFVPAAEVDWIEADGNYVVLHADRKSTRLNSSHLVISYAVFCLKKKTHIRALMS